MNRTRTIFFESHSVLRVLLLLPKIRGADLVYFHLEAIPLRPGRSRSRWDAHALRLVHLANKRAEIRTVSRAVVNHHWLISNRESANVIDSLETLVEQSRPYKLVSDLIQDRHIIKYYKHRLVTEYVPYKIHFWKVAQELAQQHGAIVPVPTEDHGPYTPQHTLGLGGSVPKAVTSLNTVVGLIKGAAYISLLASFPVLYLAREVLRRGLTLGRPKPLTKDVSQSVTRGIKEDTLDAALS